MRINFVNGTLSTLEERFDTILYIDVLEHIEDHKSEMKLAWERLNKGGRIIVLSPAFQFLYSPFDEKIGHFRRYTKKSLRDTAPDLKDRLVKLKYLDSVGLLASLVNSLFMKISDPTLEQIKIWDTFMVPVSNKIDFLFSAFVGKQVMGVWEK